MESCDQAGFQLASLPKDELAKLVKQIEAEMKTAAKALEFERAAALARDLGQGEPAGVHEVEEVEVRLLAHPR